MRSYRGVGRAPSGQYSHFIVPRKWCPSAPVRHSLLSRRPQVQWQGRVDGEPVAKTQYRQDREGEGTRLRLTAARVLVVASRRGHAARVELRSVAIQVMRRYGVPTEVVAPPEGMPLTLSKRVVRVNRF